MLPRDVEPTARPEHRAGMANPRVEAQAGVERELGFGHLIPLQIHGVIGHHRQPRRGVNRQVAAYARLTVP